MLDDRHGRLEVVERGTTRSVGVDVVVVGHLLALQLLSPGERRLVVRRQVHRRALVGVLAVAEHVAASPRGAHPRREAGAVGIRGDDAAQPGGHRDVVGRGVGEGLDGQGGPLLEGEATGRHGIEHVGVPRRRRDDGDVGVVLRRRPHHGGAADVDLLDAVVDPGSGGHRLLERVEVHDDQLEREDAEVLELLPMGVLAQVGEQPAVDVRVERLHPAVERLGEARDIADRSDGYAGGSDGAGGGPRRDDLDAGEREAACQLLEPGLVVHRDEGASHRTAGRVAHGFSPIS